EVNNRDAIAAKTREPALTRESQRGKQDNRDEEHEAESGNDQDRGQIEFLHCELSINNDAIRSVRVLFVTRALDRVTTEADSCETTLETAATLRPSCRTLRP